jgi:hypothetical protein
MAGEHISDADLDWLAFRYAAGELSGAELDTFEMQLATDERACAAVARAVQLGQAIVYCEQPAESTVRTTTLRGPAANKSRRFGSRRIIAVYSAAFSLLFVAWLVQQASRPHIANEAASTVAALWIDGADEDTPSEPAVTDDVTELVEDEPLPGWLLTAVNQQRRAIEDDEIMND